jgi:hypothetical protein
VLPTPPSHCTSTARRSAGLPAQLSGPNASIVTVHDATPTHSFSTTACDDDAWQLLSATYAPHTPLGVPYDANTTPAILPAAQERVTGLRHDNDNVDRHADVDSTVPPARRRTAGRLDSVA